MPKKKTVPETDPELLDGLIPADEAVENDIPAGVPGIETDMEEETGACQDVPLEQEASEAALPEAEESAAPEILSVFTQDSGEPSASENKTEDFALEFDGEPPVSDGGDTPGPDVTALDSHTPETKTAPRRRALRKFLKAAKDTKQSEAPPADEEPKALKNPASPEESDRRSFYDLDFSALDRSLSPEQRQEWNSIYASYRGRSMLTGTIAGVDKHSVRIRDRRTGEMTRQEMYCAVVIPFRVRILIPSTEMWMQGEERPDFVLRNMSGASIDIVVTHVDREAGFAIASRRLALRTRRYYFSTQPTMNRPGARIKCRVLAVGPRRCLVECGGYDIDLTQREMRYTAIPDLREQYRRGDELDCVVKEYDRESGKLSISVKEVNPNPFDGAALRHPEGTRRLAEIAGKYGGGVFCNLTDGVVVMCSYSSHYDDAAFATGDKVIVVIQRYDFGKKQIYGKIVAKW